MKASVENKLVLITQYTVVTVIVVIFLIPIFWALSTSLKLPTDIMALPPKLIFKPTLKYYKSILFQSRAFKMLVGVTISGFSKNLLNSLIICSSATLLTILIGSPAAYSLARMKSRGGNLIALYIISTRMLPGIGILIPFYIILSKLRILDTHGAMIIVYVIFSLPLAIWMLKGFFQEVPVELEEASLIDGCSRLGALFKIVLPLAAPGLMATAVLCLIFIWNEFMFAMVLTDRIAKTATVAASQIISYREVNWGELCAAGIVISFPILVFTLAVQKHFVRGLTFGALK